MTIRGKIIKYRELPPSTCLMPVPAAMVTCRGADGKENIITISWIGIVCSEPPMLSISVRPGRFSRELLEQNGDFVVNLPSAGAMIQADRCGMVSGRDVDKFEEIGWTAIPAAKVNASILKECPLALECRTRQKIGLGSHDLFLAEILAVQVHEEMLDANGRLKIEAIEPLAYCPNCQGGGQYWSLKEVLGHYGVSREHHKRI
jgi:flavin reductase (DIM6/NTAB) family NADH-FMN oxidoreductase RutF